MDYQNDVMDMVAAARERNVPAKARHVLDSARADGVAVIHGRIVFRDGYPEIAPISSIAMIKGFGRLLEGTHGGDFCQEVAPLPDEIVVTRRRVNMFLNTELNQVLRAMGARTLVRDASDRDYSVIVLEDCCANQTEESHKFILDNLLVGTTIAFSDDFISTLG